MRAWEIILLALNGLRRTPLRVALTALGVTIASGAIVSMVGFALGLQAMIETPFEKLELLNIIGVRPPRKEAKEKPPRLDDAAVERLSSIPGVEVAYPELRAAGVRVRRGERESTGRAFGIPREMLLLGTFREFLVAGDSFDLGDEPQAMLGRKLAEALGFGSPEEAIGATVTLEASGLLPEGGLEAEAHLEPEGRLGEEGGVESEEGLGEERELEPREGQRFTFERRRFELKIAAVFELPAMAEGFAGNGILLPIELMKEIPGVRSGSALERLRSGVAGDPRGYNAVVVRAKHTSQVPEVEARIRALGYSTTTVVSRLEEMRALFLFLDVLLACVGGVALVVAGLGITNTLLMSVLERYQEIGISKAIGASDGDLRLLFLAEAGIVGLLGGCGGIVLGRLVSALLEMGVNAYARSQGLQSHLDVFAFPAWLLGSAVLFAVGISVAAGVFPAARAARLDPIRALRGE